MATKERYASEACILFLANAYYRMSVQQRGRAMLSSKKKPRLAMKTRKMTTMTILKVCVPSFVGSSLTVARTR